MAGGYDRIRVDTLADYSDLRRMAYDIDITPLPDSLRLSAKDENLNQLANWRVNRVVEPVTP
jgi:hypothetical protein